MPLHLKIIIVCITAVLCLFCQDVQANELINVHGDLDLQTKILRLNCDISGERLELVVQFQERSKIALNTKLTHIKIGKLDVLANLYTNALFFYSKEGLIEKIKLDTKGRNILINHLPVEDIFLNAEITNNALRINSFEGIHCHLFGFVELYQPYNLNLLARIRPFSLAGFAKTFNHQDPNIVGDLEGVAKLEGVLQFPQIKANLVVYNGKLEGVPFKESVINFEGSYPVVRFKNSNILGVNDDLYNLEGFLDLSKLDNLESPFHNFMIEPTGNKLQFADWNLMKSAALDKEFTFKREEESFSVSFDSYIKDETKFRDENKDTFELKLKIDDEQSVNMKIKEDEGIVGLERRIEF